VAINGLLYQGKSQTVEHVPNEKPQRQSDRSRQEQVAHAMTSQFVRRLQLSGNGGKTGAAIV
jgi:hypothetical protein